MKVSEYDDQGHNAKLLGRHLFRRAIEAHAPQVLECLGGEPFEVARKVFYENPESVDTEAVGVTVMQFLIHAPAHVAAASKLVTGLPVSDVFGIGATSEDKT